MAWLLCFNILIVSLFSVGLGQRQAFASPKAKQSESNKLKEGSSNNETPLNIDKIDFTLRKLLIGKQRLTVEVADTEAKQERGLMFRKSLSENQGMLFIFREERILSFWMKNTFIDLDIGFFDKGKKLVDIQTMKGVKSIMETDLQSYPSLMPALYALEVPKGWFERNQIKVGATFILK
jgi:uncharacterized membrane protein (UPF0127 family)